MQITDQTIAGLISAGKPLVIDFWAPWCGPCRMLSPVVEELEKEYEGKVTIGSCNVDENPASAGDLGIRSIPTLVFFKDGKLVDRSVGVVPKEVLVEKINALL
ncbi:MAG TPA: thioredoxin [Bacteroidales bacterium]|nr:thioredoxin [Bacteroidales bacterium]